MSCATTINNLQKSLCSPQYGQIRKVWLDSNDAGVTLVNALLEATWTTKVNLAEASRMYVLNENPFDAVWEFGDAQILEGNTTMRMKANDGTQRLTLTYANLSLCKKEALKTLDGQTRYAYFITSNEYIIGSGDSTNLIPIEVKIFVDEARPSETANDLWKTNVHIDIVPTYGIWINAVDPFTANAWRPSLLNGIEDVLFSAVTADILDKTVIFDINTYCDGTEVVALTTATDFKVSVASTGAALIVDSVTYDGNTATLIMNTGTPLTAVAHNLELKNQPAMTVKGFETRSAIAFTPVP